MHSKTHLGASASHERNAKAPNTIDAGSASITFPKVYG